MKRIVPVWPMIIAEAGLGVLFYSIFPYLISKYNYVELLVVFIFLSTVLVSVHLVVIAKQKKLPNMQIFKKNVSKNIEFLSKILFSAVILLGYLVLFLSLYRIYPPTLIPVFLFLLVSSVVLSKLWEGLLPIEMFLTLTMLSITPVLLITQSCMATLDLYYQPKSYAGPCKIERTQSKNGSIYNLYLHNGDSVQIQSGDFWGLMKDDKVYNRQRMDCSREVQVEYLHYSRLLLMLRKL
ncbi:hypothetical protein KC921_02910 [Candidatus Woesebacteria bacterium]|nr:hypothetical protein [Candidatus Woesebacteria bacterium]